MPASLKKLLESLGINGVEHKTIEDIAVEIYSGNGITKTQIGSGDYPCVKCKDVNSLLPLCFYECVSYVDKDLVNNPRYFKKGYILIGDLAPSKENIGASVVYLGDRKCLAANHVVVLRHSQNPKYLAYALSTEKSVDQKRQRSISGVVTELKIKEIKKITIPLPPLEIQEKIVEILDRFCESKEKLKTRLKEEINNREKQYEYYRELLIKGGGLTFLLTSLILAEDFYILTAS